MPCNDYLELISAHIDNEINKADERRLQSHLAGCSSCRALLDAYVQADSGLASLSVEAPEGLKDAVMKSLPKQAKKERHFGRYAGIGLAAAAALALVIGFSTRLPSLNAKKDAVREAPAAQDQYFYDTPELGAVNNAFDTFAATPAPTDAPAGMLDAAEDATEGASTRHFKRDGSASAQTVAVLENTDGRALPELDSLEPTACFSNADDLSELPIALPDVSEDGLYFIKVYEIDRESFLSIVETYEGELPLTYDDILLSPTVCIYVLTPAE